MFHSNHNPEVKGGSGGMERSLRGKSDSVAWVLSKTHCLEEIMDDKQERGSVAENLSLSEDNTTTLTSSVRTTREIASGFWPEKKTRGTHIQRRLKIFFPQNNITYKNKVVVQEVHYYTYDVLVTGRYCLVHNVKFPICHRGFLKPYSLESHRIYGQKNTPPIRNLITSATESLSSLISF